VAPTVVHVAPHPDDETVGCPGSLLHLLDRGWTVVSVISSLGFTEQWERRRAEAKEASARAGFLPIFLDPPLTLDIEADLEAATHRLATEIPSIVKEYDASIVVSPSPHDNHHGHETVGRGVQRAMAVLPPSTRWWMWGVWGDLPAPNVYYAFDQRVLDRAIHALEAYAGELARNDYRAFITARAVSNAIVGSERVFGFGSARVSSFPYAELLTEVRLVDGRFMASEPHLLDEGPAPSAWYDVDLTPWLDALSVREIVDHVREVRSHEA
jgi:LmbE family N-acetylglucosaminyl deacetylase